MPRIVSHLGRVGPSCQEKIPSSCSRRGERCHPSDRTPAARPALGIRPVLPLLLSLRQGHGGALGSRAVSRAPRLSSSPPAIAAGAQALARPAPGLLPAAAGLVVARTRGFSGPKSPGSFRSLSPRFCGSDLVCQMPCPWNFWVLKFPGSGPEPVPVANGPGTCVGFLDFRVQSRCGPGSLFGVSI